MTPARDNDPPGSASRKQGPTKHSTTPIPPTRIRRTRRLRGLRLALHNPRPARQSTVWPCAQDGPHECTGLLANWLLSAVIKIVTTYTQPGQRVLLLEPAPYFAPPESWSAAATRDELRPGPYAGLHEAGWTVVRLGRGVQTQTAVAHVDPAGACPGDSPAESESGPRMRTDSPTTDQLAVPSAAPDPTATKISSDQYDLVVTATTPRTIDWLRPIDWAGLLTPNGTLAVITHGDHRNGRLIDPASCLVRAAHREGLRYLDRIALLRVPVRDGALAVTAPATHARSQDSARPHAASIRHAQVHDDLLVFSRRPTIGAAVGGQERSDD